MDTPVKLALSCCMLMLMRPLFPVYARQTATSRKIEVERYLARVNKPYVKSIRCPTDIIDCVLIGDQPTLDHPLLKDHTIRMRPTNYPETTSVNATMPKEKYQVWEHYGSCPEGTVPIRRTSKEEALRILDMKEKHSKESRLSANMHEYAIAAEEGGEYLGARAYFNIWKPHIALASEFSLAQLWLIAQHGSHLNTVEAGWQVYPALYQDFNPRFFIFFTNNSYQAGSGCYNLECTGFVKTNSQGKVVGAAFSTVSTFGGIQVAARITIFQDPFINDWWLKWDDELLGYWPAKILPLLSDGATIVHWGGEVVNRMHFGRHTTTGMGSGHFPAEGFSIASYVRNLEVIPKDGTDKWSPPARLYTIATHPNCYDIQIQKQSRDWGTYFYYGGPGYNSKCP